MSEEVSPSSSNNYRLNRTLRILRAGMGFLLVYVVISLVIWGIMERFDSFPRIVLSVCSPAVLISGTLALYIFIAPSSKVGSH